MSKLVNTQQYRERSIRVFISSTFRDMQAERDVLVKKVFPQLRKLCEERAATWTEVDLRWGITTEEASEGKVLPLCLAEIQRCRPYFIGLLGERYGWVPKDTEIPQDLLDTHPWLKDHSEHSVTELEILYGVLRDPAMADRSLFYFRDPAYVEKLKPEEKHNFITENTESAEKQKKLKDRIREAHTHNDLQYAPRENYLDPEALGAMILADFTAIIEQLYPKEDMPDPLDQEAMRHEAYARSRRLAFVGRKDLLRQIDEHVFIENKPLVLTGDSGCGKSALLAEWLTLWRKANPDDLVIQHYTGSTSESAVWQGLVRRVLGELKRTFAIADELPIQPDSLRTALQDWLPKAAGKRRVIIVLDALNQLSSDDPIALQLSWLPFTFPPNVCLLVSSLSGVCLDALHRRHWSELVVPLFGRADIGPATLAYFKIFSKTPSQEIVTKLESTPAACNPLYLRAVLDELRQFGKYEELEDKATDYLAAQDLPDLFDRILTRWHDDFGKDPKNPDLVRRSLCLIASARFGLSESELLDLLSSKNAQKEKEPLPHRYWTPFYLAAENALAQRAGLLTFGHNYLRAAVKQRWLKDDALANHYRLQLADYFGKIPEPTDRKLDELPTLLLNTAQWEQLKDLLADLLTFLCLYEHKRWKWELHRFWLALGGHFDPVEIYNHVLAMKESDLPQVSLSKLLSKVARFYEDIGRYAEAELLCQRALELSEHLLGLEHPDTLHRVNDLAVMLVQKKDYSGAEPLLQRALEARERVLGPYHPDTLESVNNLAALFYKKKDYSRAEPFYRLAIEALKQIKGPEHPNTIDSINNLSILLVSKGDYSEGETLLRFVLEANERVRGPEHPNTLSNLNCLADLFTMKGSYEEAEPLYRRALEGYERVFGLDHPDTLGIVKNLASMLEKKKDYAGAELLYQRALEACDRVHGHEHQDTLTIVNNIAELLKNKGSYKEAEPLYRRALGGYERVLGLDHPDTLGIVNNLASLLEKMEDYTGAEPLYQRALEASERVAGLDHPNTLIIVSNLAGFFEKLGNYARAELLYRRAMEGRERVLGPDDAKTLNSMQNLADLLKTKGDYAQAEPLYRRALEGYERVLGPDHFDTLGIVNNLAFILYTIGDYAGAEPLYYRVLAASERMLGTEHLATFTIVNNIAELLKAKGDYTKAEPLYRRALEGCERLLGRDHSVTLDIVNNLADLLGKKEDYAGAELLCRRAMEGHERVLGPDDAKTLNSMQNLADLLKTKGDYAQAEPLYRRALEGYERVLGPDHFDKLGILNNLALLLYTRRDYAGAELLYRRAQEISERMLGPEHPNTLTIVNNIATLLKNVGNYKEAEPLYRRLLEISEHILGSEHPDTLKRVNDLAALLYQKEDYAGAELLYRRAMEVRERVLGPEHPDTITSANNLALLLYTRRDYAGAEPLYHRVLEISERVRGPEHHGTLTIVNNIAELLKAKGDYTKAEPLFLRALKGICVISRQMGKEHRYLQPFIKNYASCLEAMGMHEKKIKQKIDALLKSSGLT